MFRFQQGFLHSTSEQVTVYVSVRLKFICFTINYKNVIVPIGRSGENYFALSVVGSRRKSGNLRRSFAKFRESPGINQMWRLPAYHSPVSSGGFDEPRVSCINIVQIINISFFILKNKQVSPSRQSVNHPSPSQAYLQIYIPILTNQNNNHAILPYNHRPPPCLPPPRSCSESRNLHPLPLRLRLRLRPPLASPRRLPACANICSSTAQRNPNFPPQIRCPRSGKLIRIAWRTAGHKTAGS